MSCKVLFLFYICQGFYFADADEKKPNIIFIMADDLVSFEILILKTFAIYTEFKINKICFFK